MRADDYESLLKYLLQIRMDISNLNLAISGTQQMIAQLFKVVNERLPERTADESSST